MISTDLRHLADWCARNGGAVAGGTDAFTILGLAAHLDDLASQAEALERAVLPANARAVDLPAGVIDLAAHRRRPPTPQDGGHAA
jgi:hypothetical protein